MSDINFQDKKTWDLFKNGYTKGVFQLESNLGKAWSKRLAPSNIEELSALIAIIRPGCISGDTLVTIKKCLHKDGGHRYSRVPIRDLSNKITKPDTILALNENWLDVVEHNMLDVFYSGEKECFRVNIRKYSMGGSSKNNHPKWYDLECTSDHKLLRSDMEWVELKDLQTGDRIATLKKQNNRTIRDSSICNRHHPEAPRQVNVEGTRYFAEICYKHYKEQCVVCGWNETTLDVHHLKGNRHTDNHYENLAFLCPNCHRKEIKGLLTQQEILQNREGLYLPISDEIEWVTYVGKESVGVKDTYDISMDSPNHNFIAGNFIVHNCLKAITDGKSMTQHYVDRKHGRDKVTYLDNSLEDVLKATYGVLVYQEQSMRIAQKLAGFDLKEADELRKAIGKKKADLMAKIKTKFISGCVNTGIVKKKIAEDIFGWIEKSSRYALNKSHSVSYAVNAYHTAWYKANHTKEFFLSYLYHAADKQDPHQEIYELVSEAKLFNIEVKVPSLTRFSQKFEAFGDDIYFGVKDIKSLTGVSGDKVIETVKSVEEELGKPSRDFSWMDVLIYLSPKINSTSFKALASIGFFSTKSTGVSRNKALYEYEIFRILTKKEQEWVNNNYSAKEWVSLKDCFTDIAPTKKEGGGTSTVARSQTIQNEIEMIDNPPFSLDDDPSWIIDQEIKFLGCPVSLSRIDAADTSAATTTCKEIVDGKYGGNLCVAGNIIRINTVKTKNGKNPGQLMCFLTIEDETCMLDSVVVFPETRQKYEYMLYEGNNLLFCGEVKKGDNSFIIEKIHEI